MEKRYIRVSGDNPERLEIGTTYSELGRQYAINSGQSVADLIEVNWFESDEITGKTAVAYYNSVIGQMFYEYVDRPMTESEKLGKLELENEALRQSQAEQDEIIMTLLLGGM